MSNFDFSDSFIDDAILLHALQEVENNAFVQNRDKKSRRAVNSSAGARTRNFPPVISCPERSTTSTSSCNVRAGFNFHIPIRTNTQRVPLLSSFPNNELGQHKNCSTTRLKNIVSKSGCNNAISNRRFQPVPPQQQQEHLLSRTPSNSVDLETETPGNWWMSYEKTKNLSNVCRGENGLFFHSLCSTQIVMADTFIAVCSAMTPKKKKKKKKKSAT